MSQKHGHQSGGVFVPRINVCRIWNFVLTVGSLGAIVDNHNPVGLKGRD